MRSPTLVLAGLLLSGALVAGAEWTAKDQAGAAGLDSTTTLTIPGPPGSSKFGAGILVLTNGNYVIGDPGFDLPGTTDVGAVYLYDGATNHVISRLTGSHTNDQVGSGTTLEVGSSNIVVTSPSWGNAGIQSAGAATWINGTTGLAGQVSAANSIVGSSAD